MDIKKRRAKMESNIIMGGVGLAVVACVIFAIFSIPKILNSDGADPEAESSAVPTLTIQTLETVPPTATNTRFAVPTTQTPPTETPTPVLSTLDPDDPNTPETPFLYEVRSDDTAYRIAQNFGVDFLLLLSVNDLTAESVIYPGDFLIIPDPGMEKPTPTLTPTRVQALMVAQGDNAGVVLRDAPSGNIITSYLNYTLVEILADEPVTIAGRVWNRVLVLQDNQTGWILTSLLVTATPNP